MAGHISHVLHRGNGRATVFHKDSDDRAFLDLFAKAKARFPVRLLGFRLMLNHFPLVIKPATASPLSPVMPWWVTSYVRRSHQQDGGSGPVWQRRCKSFPIQQDAHLLTVLHSVLGNPVRAGLVQGVHDWPWTSVHHHPARIDPWPVDRPANWDEWLAQPRSAPEWDALRRRVIRQAPYGAPEWQAHIATTHGLESTLRPRGRPRNTPDK